MRDVNALSAELILAAEKKRVRIDTDYARRYISARQTLQANPEDPEAHSIVRHFELLMSDFGRFKLPDEDYQKHCGYEEKP